MNLVRYYEHQKFTVRSDEQVVTRAKEMGKELFSYLPPNERREKLDAMVTIIGMFKVVYRHTKYGLWFILYSIRFVSTFGFLFGAILHIT